MTMLKNSMRMNIIIILHIKIVFDIAVMIFF